MKALASRRRHPAAIVILLLLGLAATGGLYSLLAPKPAQAAVASADDVNAGTKLFLANCATCHGISGLGGPTGPSLVGVGAAAVDFQVGTGRMPLAGPGCPGPPQQTRSSSPTRRSRPWPRTWPRSAPALRSRWPVHQW